MPSGSDWVTARAACSIPAQFEFLCNAVRSDVNARNKLREHPNAGEFRFEPRGNSAVVTRADNERVSISMTDNAVAIEIRGHTDREIDLAVMLDDHLRCKMVEIGPDGTYIPGTERPVGDLPRLVLDRLFFDFGSDLVRRH